MRLFMNNELEYVEQNILETGDYSVSVINPLVRNAPKKVFQFDSVYDGLSKTDTIYNDMCYSLVESTLEGYNGTIFAYGQTGCGKTHTMQVTLLFKEHIDLPHSPCNFSTLL